MIPKIKYFFKFYEKWSFWWCCCQIAKKEKPEEHFYGDKSASKSLCGILWFIIAFKFQITPDLLYVEVNQIMMRDLIYTICKYNILFLYR